MKIAGLLLLILGGVGLVTAWHRDVTVETGGQTIGSGEFAMQIPRTRVVNIGLMEERRNYLGLSALGVLAGLMLIGFGSIMAASRSDKPAPDSRERCPICRECVDNLAANCEACHAPLTWLQGKPVTQEELAEAARGPKRPPPLRATPLR